MATSVKVSDALLLDARATAELSDRSIAGQIEHWARLGRAVESIMQVPAVADLKKRAAMTLNESVAQIGTPEGRCRLKETLQRKAFPHYEPVQERAGYLTRIEADGTRRVGRFAGRQFIED